MLVTSLKHTNFLKPKFILILLVMIISLLFSDRAKATVNFNGSDDNSEVSEFSSSNSSKNQNLHKNTLSLELSLGKRLELAKNIFSDPHEDNYEDTLFSEAEIFVSKNIAGESIDNAGVRLNLGYSVTNMRVFLSSGYLGSYLKYQVDDETKSKNKGSPFVGFGLGYDLSKNIGLRINSMFYRINFHPTGSQIQEVDIDVSAVNIGLSYHF